MQIEIQNLIPKVDPFHRKTGTPTKTSITVFPHTARILVDQALDPQHFGVLNSVLHDVALYYRIKNHPSKEALEACLASLRPVFDVVFAGHEIYWNGEQFSGRLNDTAKEAWDRICNALDQLEPHYSLTDAFLWLNLRAPSYRQELKERLARKDLIDIDDEVERIEREVREQYKEPGAFNPYNTREWVVAQLTEAQGE